MKPQEQREKILQNATKVRLFGHIEKTLAKIAQNLGLIISMKDEIPFDFAKPQIEFKPHTKDSNELAVVIYGQEMYSGFVVAAFNDHIFHQLIAPIFEMFIADIFKNIETYGTMLSAKQNKPQSTTTEKQA